MSKFILLASLMVLLASCQLTQREPSPLGEGGIDAIGLRRSLGLERSIDTLGWQERRFNTCDVGHGYPSNSNCRELYMAVLNFRLLCRDSVGTVSVVNEMTPISGQRLRWELGPGKGITQTNHAGYGQIALITRQSQAGERLIVFINDQYFGVRANELKMHVLPGNWCN